MLPSIQILKKSCELYWYTFTSIDKVSKNLFQVSYKDQFFYANWCNRVMYPSNKHFASEIISDKAYTYQILWLHWFSIPRSYQIYLDDYAEYVNNDHKEDNITSIAKKISYPVFVKPNNSSFWKAAEVIYNTHDLKKHIDPVKSISKICLIQEYIQAPEYRIFVVNWEIQFSYKRNALSIIWNWVETVEELLKKSWNLQYKTSQFLRNQLIDKKLHLNSILEKKQTLYLQSKSNISAGWSISDIKTLHNKQLQVWVKNLVNKFDISVTGIDIFAPKWINSPKDFIIIELNSNPSLVWIYRMWYEKLVHEIWKKILSSYFQ